MRKFIFVLIAILGITSCSWFDSDPIEPNILGVGNLHKGVGGVWFVVIDTSQYTVSNVTIPDNNPRSFSKTQGIDPVEGMLVTIFTSPRKASVQAVVGRQSAEEIERLYHTNSTGFVTGIGIIVLCVVLMAIPTRRKGSGNEGWKVKLFRVISLFSILAWRKPEFYYT